MAKIYYRLILNGSLSGIEDVPPHWREATQLLLSADESVTQS